MIKVWREQVVSKAICAEVAPSEIVPDDGDVVSVPETVNVVSLVTVAAAVVSPPMPLNVSVSSSLPPAFSQCFPVVVQVMLEQELPSQSKGLRVLAIRQGLE